MKPEDGKEGFKKEIRWMEAKLTYGKIVRESGGEGGNMQTYSEIFEAVPARTFDVRLNHV